MRIVQTCILLMLLLSVNGQTQLAIGNQPLQLRNAYETARALYAADAYTKKLPDSVKQQLLGSLIWYADLQDGNGDLYRQLGEKLSEYPVLQKVMDKLSDSLIKLGKFFQLKATEINTYADSLPFPLKDSIIKKKELYDTEKKAYDSGKAAYKSLTTALRGDLTAMLKLKEEKRIYFDALFSTLTNTDEITLAKKRDADSVKIIEDSISRLNIRYDTARIAFRGREILFNQLESSILQFINKNQRKLVGFLFKISGVDETVGRPGVNFEDAMSAFNQSTAPNIQKALAEAETAYRLSLKLPSEAEMINALAIYLANRIKQESVMWFFEKMTQNAARHELLNLFFPATVKLLQGNEVYEIPNLGAQWQYALSKDFMQMPENVLNSQWLKERWPEAKIYGPYISGVCNFAELLVKRYSYRDAIKSLYLSTSPLKNSNDIAISQPVFNDYITLLYAINSELFIVDATQQYRLLGYEDLRNMSRKEMELMFGLLDMKYRHVFSKFFTGIRQTEGNIQSALDVESLRRLLGNIRTAIGQVERIGIEYKEEQARLQQTGQKDWSYNTYNIWGAVNRIFHVFTELDNKLVSPQIFTQAKKTFGYGEQVFEIYNLITKKNFAGAVMNALSLIDTLLYNEQINQQLIVKLDSIRNHKLYTSTILKETLLKEIKKYESVLQYKYLDSLQAISFKKASPVAALLFDNDRQAVQLIRKLSGFLNDAALAQNDKQLAKVVESYAMPVGSYKRKRNNWWSVDLNAFAGVYAGYEWARRQQNDTSKLNGRRGGAVWGFSVPIGISVSKTFGRKWKAGKKEFDAQNGMFPDDYVRNPDKVKIKKQHLYNRTGWTLTVTASIVDLGAPVSYRLFQSKDTAIGQSFKWSQLISPGLHIAVALPGSPFTVSTGIQYTPQLRKYQEAGKPNEQQFNTTRAYLGLMFDLPLFNFWERKHIVYRKKK